MGVGAPPALPWGAPKARPGIRRADRRNAPFGRTKSKSQTDTVAEVSLLLTGFVAATAGLQVPGKAAARVLFVLTTLGGSGDRGRAPIGAIRPRD